MDDVIRDALDEAAPDRTPSAVEAPDGSANPGNRTVRVRFADGGEAYLKVAVDCDRTRLARAAAVLRYASAHLSVRVPAVVAADPAADPPFLLTAPLRGTPVAREWEAMSTDERATLLRAVGRTLAAIHEPTFDQAGRIVGGDEAGLTIDADPWPDVLAASVRSAGDPAGDPADDVVDATADHAADDVADDPSGERPDNDASGDSPDDDAQERFRDLPGRARDAVRTRRDELLLAAPGDDAARPSPSLLHGDSREANCLRDDGAVGFVDWEQAVVGDPVLGLVRTAGHFLGSPELAARDRLRSALRDGYRERAGGLPPGFETRRRVYRVVTFLPVASRFDRWAPHVDEPTEELVAWVRDEFDRRLHRLESGS